MNTTHTVKVLFVCGARPALSRMAEAFTRARSPDGVLASSAALQAGPVDPLARAVMAEAGLDLDERPALTPEQLGTAEHHIVIALCKRAAAELPRLPGNPLHVCWDLDVPERRPDQSRDEALDAMRAVREQLREMVDDFFGRGYFAALAEAKMCSDLILDNISEGIIAHDLNRRIFYFNRAAEAITGYTRAEVLNRDCHDVFAGSFCGGKCAFCDGVTHDCEQATRALDVTTRQGEARALDTSCRAIRDCSGTQVGFMVAFTDRTRERDLARRVREARSFAGIVGNDEKMLAVFDLIRDLADVDMPILIQGESGTGKELIASAIHNEGQRAGRRFVPVNCGALPEGLLETELFGHVKGAFTGAIRARKGRFELADGGTIFLDEIGDLSPAMQVKLLRVLQEGTFEPVGGEQTRHVDVRVISATNKDLAEEMARGRFREDLFYRLSVVPIYLPSLRERTDDIPLLVDYILQNEQQRAGRDAVTVSPQALDAMMEHGWPGNVRELQNWIQFALVRCKGKEILPEHLPPVRGPHRTTPGTRGERGSRKLTESAVREALRKTNGNRLRAAKLLGVSRATLYRFLGRG